MDRNNFFFKTISVTNYDSILMELQNYCLGNMPNDSSQFSHINKDALLANSPHLKEWLTSKNLDVRICALIRTPPQNKKVDPHTDTQRNDLALNFPIRNCFDCWTSFYKLSRGTQQEKILPNGLTYTTFSEDAIIDEVDKFHLTTATLLNTKQLHQVWNPTNEIRISVSLRFVRDPWELV